MATELAKAYVQIVPSAKGIKGSITEALGGEASSAGDSAGGLLGSNLVSAIKKVVVAAGLGKMLQETITEGANLEQSIGGVETLFKESADTVKQYANEAYKSAGLSANDYMEQVTSFSASLLKSLDGDTSKAAESANSAVIDMSDNANKMGTNIEDIQNAYQGFAKQNYTMLDNLKLGYGGTKSEMERLLAEAEKLSGVHYNLDNLDDVYSAIHVIQGDLEISGRTAEEAAEIYERTGRQVGEQLGTTAKEAETTLLGSLSSMKSAFSNVLGQLAIGGDVESALGALADSVVTFAAGNLAPMVGRILSGLPQILQGASSIIVRSLNIAANNADTIVQMGIDLVTGLAQAIVGAVPYLGEAAVNLISALGSALLNTDWAQVASDLISGLNENLAIASGEIFGGEGNILTELANSITTNLPTIMGKGTEIVSSLVSGITENLPSFIAGAEELLSGFAGFITENLPTILQGGVEIVTTLVNGILENLPALIEGAGELLSGFVGFIADNLPTILETGVELLLNLVQGIVDNLPEIIVAAVKALDEFRASIFENLPDILETGIELLAQLIVGINSAIPKLIAAIPDIIASMVDSFLEYDWLGLGADILAGIGNGIAGAVSAVVKAAKEAAQSIFNSVKDFFDIGSPSKLMRDEIGKWIPAGIAVGIEKNLDPVTEAMNDITALTTGTLSSDIEYGLKDNQKALNRAVSVQGWSTANATIDYDRVGESVAGALANANLTIKVGKREAGRIVREVMA